jgi:PAS domain-containing protein
MTNSCTHRPWVLAYSFPQGDQDNESGSETESSAGTSTPGRAARMCTLAGASGKAVGQVPLSFDRKDEKDPFVRIIRKALRYGETIVLRRNDSDIPSWIFEMEHSTDSSYSCRSALLIPIRPTSRNDIEGQNVVGFLIVGLAASREYDNDYEQFAHLCSRQLATSAASIMLLEQEIRRQEQLAEQLSISARQKQELEMKLSRFADISNIGMWISSTSGELLYANKAWYEQAELPFLAANMTVEKWIPLVTEESLGNFQRNWAKLIEHQQPVTFECQFKSRWRSVNSVTGEVLEGPRWFLISALPEFGDDGEMTKAWGCNVDVR